MSVCLIGMTTPSAITGCNTANELIAYAARVSNPENQNNTETASKLLKYLIKHQHWSPFEMVSVTLSITTTRDISRQILRHRSFSFQEFSQRYAVSTNFQTRDCRLQDRKNRQNSIETDDADLSKWWKMAQEELIRKSKLVYQSALDHGIAKEQARAVLPEGNTETTLYMSGTLRSWVHYCKLRTGPETQQEHIDVAAKCWDVLRQHFPDVAKAVEEL